MVINPIVGIYIHIIRIPIKGGMTIPNIATFDHGTFDVRSLVVETKTERPSMEKTERKSWADMHLGGVGVYEVPTKKPVSFVDLEIFSWKNWMEKTCCCLFGFILSKFLRTMSV